MKSPNASLEKVLTLSRKVDECKPLVAGTPVTVSVAFTPCGANTFGSSVATLEVATNGRNTLNWSPTTVSQIWIKSV
jgi:hypothetical protein